MLPQEIIRRKRDNKELTTGQIRDFIRGVSDGSVADVQTAAFTMAAFLNGLNARETADLTMAMRDSGEKLEWSGFDKPVVDKHSSGGVGDKVSLALAPVLAACDVYVPMIAGRGLGHTGGTIDKLEAIPGYNTQADTALFRKTVKETGCAIIGQTAALAPADKKIYAIRDVCATVESVPLITASILSKKLAAGLQYLVMDLKCGNGAFMSSFDDAVRLAKSIVEVACRAGTKTTAVLTDMNQVLGESAGNAVEVAEAVRYLLGEKPDTRFDLITRTLCQELLVSCGRAENEAAAAKIVDDALVSGRAAEKFASMVKALGGPADFMEKYKEYLPAAPHKKPVFAAHEGYVSGMDTRAVGLSIIEMKGGRRVPGEKLDLSTGYTDFVQTGDYVDASKPLAVVHYRTEDQYERAEAELQEAISISDAKPQLQNPVLLKI